MYVLIVDDEPLMRLALLDGIQEALPEIEFVGSPNAEAAERIVRERGAPEVIVSDFVLPGKNGLQLYSDLSRRHGDLALILISALPNLIPAEVAGSKRRIRVLRKPFDLDKMVATIEELLGSHPRAD